MSFMLRSLVSRLLARSVRLPGRRLLATQRTPDLVLKDKSRPLRVERELPDPFAHRVKNRATFVTFSVGVAAALAIIFNYEKTESPIISNTFYHLRRSPRTRELLGENIEFDGLMPWVHGELNQVAGKVNIRFNIKGSNGTKAVVRLVANKDNEFQEFLIHEWSLTADDKQIDLLEEGDLKTFG
ncbi:hypothetical protein ZYGR_0AG07040 [Zygosaccharomyces rouxii]|uniref:Cytochrome c oxidase assembly factor 1 n=1 Tax=Zygosaccharomyces rouxii TaxID=4956 RepID=A0A1Q3AAW3_ZYGRO|nr:hypothetical protein ZYGR_0AG07040 [Zygosaccharomyces rouxii]